MSIGEEEESALLADSVSRRGRSQSKTSKALRENSCETSLKPRTEKLKSLDGSRKPCGSSSLGRSTSDEVTDADHRLREFIQGLRPAVIDDKEHWYNSDTQRPYTLQEIADIMGVSRERVRQIEEQGMRKMWRRVGAMVKREGLTPDDLLKAINDNAKHEPIIFFGTSDSTGLKDVF